jgi:hypothetical protein
MPRAPDERLIKFSEDEAQRLILFYSDSEKEILAELNRALLKGNQTQYIKAMKDNVHAILKDLREGSRTWCEQAIPRVYLEGVIAADAQMKSMGTSVKVGFASIHQQAAQVLAETAYNRFDDVAITIGRRVDDIYRTLALENIKGSVVGYKSWQKVARNLREQLAEHGVTAFKDIKDRKWNMRTYAEMVARTTTMEAHLQGTALRLQEHGHDLIKVSTHSGTCEKCAPWQGKILSLSGRSKEYPSLQEAKDAGLFHPRCRHAYGLYIDLEKGDEPAPVKPTDKSAEKAPVFKTTKEAEKWAQDNLGIAHVDYTNIHITVANEINKTVKAFKKKFPQVKDTKWLSTGQQMFRAKYEAEVTKRAEQLKRMGYSDDQAIKLASRAVKKKKVPGNFMAFSTNKTWGEYEGIALSEKFVKTARGFEDMRNFIARDIASGFHPMGVEDPSSVITHEMGHQLHYLLIKINKAGFVNDAWQEFNKEVRGMPDVKSACGKLLSQYAATNDKEFFAEAIMEYMHSSSPRKYANIIGEGAEEALKGL